MLSWLVWWMVVARAGDPAPELDVSALHAQVVDLAGQNRWSGVEATYTTLVGAGAPIPPEVHLAGARAAQESGRPLLAWQRAQRASEAPARVREQLEALTTHLEARFGLVHLFVPPEQSATLVATQRPFAKLDRDAIDVAAQVVAEQGVFRGLLPVGAYELGGTSFEVRAEWSRFRIVRAGETEAP